MEANELYKLFTQHFTAWSEKDGPLRQQLIADTYTPDLEVVDAFFAGNGRDILSPFIDNLQAKFPGCRLSLTRPLEHHHDLIRAFWQFGLPGQPPATTGQDFIRIKEGKIHQLFVFLDGVNIIEQPNN